MCRPAMSEALMSIYQEAGKLLAAKEPENAAKRWLQAAAQARADGSWTLAAWLCLKAATYSPTRDEVYAAYRTAADMANASASLTLIAFVLESEARRAESFGDVDRANERYREVLRIRETLPQSTLGVARTLRDLGNVASQGGDIDKAESFVRRALSVTETEAPDSIAEARNLSALAAIALRRSKSSEAEALYGKALTLLEKLPLTAWSLPRWLTLSARWLTTVVISRPQNGCSVGRWPSERNRRPVLSNWPLVYTDGPTSLSTGASWHWPRNSKPTLLKFGRSLHWRAGGC